MLLPPIRKKCRTVHFAKQALKFILSSTRNPTSALVVTRTRSRIRPHPPPLLLSLYSPPPSARRAPYREKADFMVQPGDKSPDPASARLDPVAVRPDTLDPAARLHPRSSRGCAFLAVADPYVPAGSRSSSLIRRSSSRYRPCRARSPLHG
jgi:hypothetical protein